MTPTEPVLRYEDAAEYRNHVAGWVCKACGAFTGSGPGAEHCARSHCCTDHPCACGNRVTRRYYSICDACSLRQDEEKWQKAQAKAVPWDGAFPVCQYDGDQFFFDEDQLREYMEEYDLTPETVRLQACAPRKPREFEMSDYLSDDLPEDDRTDFKEIDRLVNDWIAANLPTVWDGSGPPLTAASIREVLAWEDARALPPGDEQEGE